MHTKKIVSLGTNEYDLSEKYLNSLNINDYNSTSNMGIPTNLLGGD